MARNLAQPIDVMGLLQSLEYNHQPSVISPFSGKPKQDCLSITAKHVCSVSVCNFKYKHYHRINEDCMYVCV